jgi:hypothetical protein
MQVHPTRDPITVTIAALAGKDNEHVMVDAFCRLASDPQYKVASWTRLRKKMESPETYKPTGVSEVLL